MDLIFISGHHPRHCFVAKKLSGISKKFTWIIEKREPFKPKTSKKINKKFYHLSIKHFNRRVQSERKFFGDLSVENSKFASDKIILLRKNFKKKIISTLKNKNADILITFGCGKIPEKVFKNRKIKHFWNIHGGLSPWFRGSITNFWPSYLLQPQFTGITLHKLSSQIDGGEILLQTSCKLISSDGIHDLNCRSIQTFCKIFKKKLKNLRLKKNINGTKQIFHGKIWKKSDWSEKNLVMIYEKFNDKIVKYCKSNNLIKIKPKLIDNL